MAVLERNGMFPPELVREMMNLVSGRSSLAKLSGAKPVGFNGNSIFTFSLDTEVDLVAESGAKSHGGASVDVASIQPVKVEYGFRTSDEFVYASEEYQLDILRAFQEGFARKLARGLDIMAFHGVNPRTDATAAILNNYNFVNNVTNTATFVPGTPDPVGNLQTVISAVESDGFETTGIIASPTFRSALADVKQGTNSNMPMFPELMFGGRPESLYGVAFDANPTVEFSTQDDLRAVVGDFENYFRWGYAKQIPVEVIQYGDPDNSGSDLKGHNQVYIRGEAYIGWGILNYDAFGVITE